MTEAEKNERAGENLSRVLRAGSSAGRSNEKRFVQFVEERHGLKLEHPLDIFVKVGIDKANSIVAEFEGQTT